MLFTLKETLTDTEFSKYSKGKRNARNLSKHDEGYQQYGATSVFGETEKVIHVHTHIHTCVYTETEAETYVFLLFF